MRSSNKELATMNRTILFSSLLAIAACGGNDTGTNPDAPMQIDPGGGKTIRLNDNITQDTTFTADNLPASSSCSSRHPRRSRSSLAR
jgi:hypothetical protein